MLKSATFWVVILAALGAAFFYRAIVPWTDPVKPGPDSIAFITGGSGEYWQAAIDGANAAAKDLGIKLVVHSPENPEDVAEQLQYLSVVSNSNVDAVAISPIEPAQESTLITQIATTKPIVTFDSDASGSGRHGYIGTSNFSAGLVAGTQVKRAIPEGGKIAVLLANDTKENLLDRKAGLRTRIAESPNPEESPVDSRYEVVGYFTDEGDNAKCEQHVRDLLEKHPELACIVTLNSRQGPIVLKTLEELGATEKVKLVAFDTTKETLEGVEEGTVFAVIAQDQYKYGYEAIAMLDSLCRGDAASLPMVGRGAVHYSVEPLRKDNIQAFRKRTTNRKPAAKK